eukprot:CAMPEP_0197073108 /NCGR_PEP_ID=MMETSP1384-20130603/210438_1 /TAXON_ID=29189 /ORGANISM="Ammonia sp." /LENGTH=310 /DNA_ID=CAMNT_0042511935 /DNA_START=865 /DNA_END=1797 /DNA_ORIENTATION=-
MTTFTLLSTLITSVFSSSGYSDESCAYFSTHVVASPLHACSAYSYDDTQYSWNFECDEADNVVCNYFLDDTECTHEKQASSTPIDLVGGFAQCVGSGDNCHTVDIKIKGFTDTSTEECTDDSDFFEFSFVVNECIPSTIAGVEYSAVLQCDSEKLWFEYYTGCKDCSCAQMERYTYEDYDDLDGCWDITCGIHEEQGVGTPSEESPFAPPQEPPACTYKSHNEKRSVDKLKQILFRPMELTKTQMLTSKKAEFAANVLNQGEVDEIIERSSNKVYNKVTMNWVYIIAVGCAVVLIAGAWRIIKQKEYSIL